MTFTVFHLAWLIPLIPLLVFAAILLLARGSRVPSRPLAVGGIAAATALALFTFLAEMLVVLEGKPEFRAKLTDGWFPLGLYVDPRGALMLAVLSLACSVIFVYSMGVLANEEGEGRFLAYLSLLAAATLGLFVFDNLLLVFVCWGGMDVCAYLLTGFRHEQASARQSALKVFLTTRVGDLLLLLGMALLYAETGSLAFGDILSTGALETLAQANPLATQFSTATVVALLFLGGVMVKGAQFPFHTWLPETTEAPAPASALLHVAATSAAAFLLIRLSPLLNAVADDLLVPSTGLGLLALVGIVTAVVATLFAVTQRDVRRALSFFVVGQLGHVLIALGMGAPVAGIFYLVVGVFFSTLLFLAAGSVTHGMMRGHLGASASEPFDPNDVFNMGGLGERQPLTFYLFLVGGAALAGSPFLTAGFWSKDAVLSQAWSANQAVFWILAALAGVTAFGVMRLLGLIFTGSPRSLAAQRAIESSSSMTLPLIFLALFTLVMGWVGIPDEFPLFGGNWLKMFLGVEDRPIQFTGEPMILWSAVDVIGLAVGFLVYARHPVRVGESDWVESIMRALWLGWLYDLLYNACYVGGLNQWVFTRPFLWLGRGLALFDDLLDELIIATLRWLGQGPSRFGGWFDARVLAPALGPVDRVATPVAQVAGWVDARIAPFASLVSRADEYPARAADILDRSLDRLVNLTKHSTLALARLSAVIDRGLSIAVNGVGHAVRMSGLWFRPKTGRVQSYLRMASIAVLVLLAMFLLFLFVRI